MGMKMVYPYLHPAVLSFALSTDITEAVGEVEGNDDPNFFSKVNSHLLKSKRWGKVVLRDAAKGLLPYNIRWRTKTDLEFGSGAYLLEKQIEESVTSEDEERLRVSGKHFWNKVHLGIYLLYEDMQKNLGLKNDDHLPEKHYNCASCGNGVIAGRTHCHTCGAYPSNQKKMFLYENGF